VLLVRPVRFSLFALAILLVSAASAGADCGLPSWCPLGCCAAKHTSATKVTTVADARGKGEPPTVMARMTSGTKRFVSNTKNLFVPKKSEPARPKTTSIRARQSARDQYETPGFFYRLFHPEPPPPPQTIDEWMSLKQIHP
jgi:hypothetical protein